MENKTSPIIRNHAVAALFLTLIPATTARWKTGHGTYVAAKHPPAKVFRSVLGKIKRTTGVPVLLPSQLPRSVRSNDIHSVRGEGKTGNYEISVGYEGNCGQACAVGYFAAERGGKVGSEFDKKVRLARGVQGYYTARSCGVSCTPPQISWQHRGVLFTIQFNVNTKSKRQDQEDIVALANSAILAGERE